MKNLFIEDCFETLKRNLTYDYVLTSPPDFDELGKDTNWSYESFLESLVEKLITFLLEMSVLETNPVFSTGVVAL